MVVGLVRWAVCLNVWKLKFVSLRVKIKKSFQLKCLLKNVDNKLFALNRLVLIDSYKPGTLQEVRLDGHTNLNGVNGAGKTTLLRLVPLFFGERPGRLVPKSRVTDSFAKHYLPHESSYIIFEYQRNTQICMALIYASPNEEGLCYRFVDKGFDPDDFLEVRGDGSLVPISCRDLGRHFAKRRINCSNQITSCHDYRTVIQNLPHKKGQELRDYIARYSFCHGGAGRRLKDIEKIVSGMLMRSTDFADLREMLVNCIDENRDSIALDVQMETLESWYKEYRAFQETEGERDKAGDLNRLADDLVLIESSLSELRQRLQLLLNRNQQDKRRQEETGSDRHRQLETLKAKWEEREQSLKSELATVKAELETAERQKTALEKERNHWENQDIQGKKQLYDRLDQIKASLNKERDNLRQLMAHVQDIEAEFRRLKAEKEKHFSEQQHGHELGIQNIRHQASERQIEARQETERQKDLLRENSQQVQDAINQAIGNLRQQSGMLNGKMAEIQPDPALLESRETKLAEQQDLQHRKQEAADAVEKINTEIKANQEQIDNVFKAKQKNREDKLRIEEASAQLRRQLDADADTLLGFLRERQPDWVNNIAKVIKPELLLRDDLEPALQTNENSFYGLAMNLDGLTADQAADEEQIRARLLDHDYQIKQLMLADSQSDEQLESLGRTAENLKKQRKAADLKLGQIQARLGKLNDELTSLKQQIERSRKDRKAVFEQQKRALDAQIEQSQVQLAGLKQQLQTDIEALKQALSARIQQINEEADRDIKQTQRLIDEINQQKGKELAQLDQQHLNSLRERKVDTATLADLETKIERLTAEQSAAEKAGQMVQDYQRWLDKEWSRYPHWLDKTTECTKQRQRLTVQLQLDQAQYLQQRKTLESELEQIKLSIAKLDKEINTLHRLLEDLRNYPKHPVEAVAFDQAHTLALLQGDYRTLTERHKVRRKELTQLISHFKRVLSRFPGTHPARYYASVEGEIGGDGDDGAWLSSIQDWYDKGSGDSRSWLVMQAQTFGSSIRNYQQALDRFDRGIDSLSRRLAAHIDTNIRFEKIESIQGRLSSKVTTLGYWDQIVLFTKNFDDWSRMGEGRLPGREFAEMVRQVSEQLQGKGRVEMKLVNLLELEIIVTENGRSKRAIQAEELRQISSHGLSYLILCVFFIALVNMIRKDQPLNIIWPMDELKELHQMNIELLVDILTKNRITLLSAFPDPDPDILRLFKNRYQVVGNRELLEMEIDEDYLASLESLIQEQEYADV